MITNLYKKQPTSVNYLTDPITPYQAKIIANKKNWLDLGDIVPGDDSCWSLTPEMLVLNEQEEEQISQEKIDAFKSGRWFIKWSEDLRRIVRSRVTYFWMGDKSDFGYFENEKGWHNKHLSTLTDYTEITVEEYKILTENKEQSFAELEAEMEAKEAEAKRFLELRGYLVKKRRTLTLA